jgi:hypothetical protein
MATKAKQARPVGKRVYQVRPIDKRVYEEHEDDTATRLSRIENKLLYMCDLERERQYEEEMNRIVAKERSKANTQYWLGLLTGVCYGVVLTITWLKKSRVGGGQRQNY